MGSDHSFMRCMHRVIVFGVLAAWLLLAPLAAQETGSGKLEVALLQARVAGLYHEGRLEEARLVAQEALHVAEIRLRPNHADIARSVNDLAVLYHAQGRLTEAEPLLKRALALREHSLPDGDPAIAQSLDNLAALYLAQGRLAEAEPLFKRALALREQSLPEGHSDIAASVDNLAFVYEEQGRFDEAEALFQRRLALVQQNLPKHHPEVAVSLNDLAKFYLAQGRLAEAEPLFESALRLREQSLAEGHPNIAASLNNLAAVYVAQKRLAAAERLFQRALALHEERLPEDHAGIATSLNNLALLYVDQGRLAEAEQLYKRVLAIREQSLREGDPDIATSLNNLAGVYHDQGELAEAESLFERALELRKRSLREGHPAITTSMSNLALVYRAQGRLAEAEPLLQRALQLREQNLPEVHPDVATSLDNLAALYLAQGRLAEAEPLFKRALDLTEQSFPEDHPEIAYILNNLAALHRAQGRFAESEKALRRAVAILVAHPNRAEFTLPSSIFDSLGNVLLNNVADGPPSAGRVAEAFSAVQWPRLGVVAAAVAAASTRLAAGDPELARLVRERQDLAATRARRDAELVQRLGAVGPARDSARRAALRSELERLDGELAARDAELAARFPAYAELAQPIPLGAEAVQTLIGAEEALLLLTTGNPGFAFLLTRERLAAAVLPGDADFSPLAARLRCSAAVTDPACGRAAEDTKSGTGPSLKAVTEDEPGSMPFDLALAHELYRQLLGPLQDLIQDRKHLIIVADGALAGFPFQLLVKEAPEAGLDETEAYKRAHWLLRDHTITVLPAVSSLRALRELAPKTASAPLPFVGFGDPVIGNGGAVACGNAGEIVVAAANGATSTKGMVRGSTGTASEALFRSGDVVNGLPVADVAAVRKLKRLPDTRCELEAIAANQGADSVLYFDVDAAESRVKELSDSGHLDDYRVVAFSTHGLVTGEAGAAEPALVLTPPAVGTTEDDGLLTASEVAALKLNADWVVLSACNTAAGDGQPDAESLSGLARAFFYAGARSILVSHWPVWSDAAVDITTRAFAKLQKDPSLGRAGALRQAMLDTLSAATDYRHTHPAYWAPFSLIGEGRV